MIFKQGFLQTYGPKYDADSGGGGGTQDQTDWKAKYETLNSQIASGQYVAKDSYVSLQQKLETTVNERKSLQQNFDNATAKYAILEDSFTKAQGTIQELQSNLGKKDGEIQGLNSKLERHTVIFKQFPALAPFEADGLLPHPTGDQKLEDLFSAFQNKLGTIQEQTMQQRKLGSTSEPPRAGDEANKTSKAFFQEALAAQNAGNLKEYDAAMNKYYAALAKEKTN